MEAPRGVEPTGTNGRTRHTFQPFPLWWVGSRPVVVSRWMARSVVSCGHDDDTGEAFCSRPLSGSRTATIGIGRVAGSVCRPIPWWVGRYIGFAVVMAQVRRPVPFRTRKLRPGRGDGTALERVWESSTPPHSTSGFPSSVTLREPPFLSFGFRGIPGRDAPGTPFLIPAHGCFLRPLEVSGRRKDRRRDDSSTHWVFCSAGRPVGGRIAPVTGSPGTLGDPRNSRGASCPYPMVE